MKIGHWQVIEGNRSATVNNDLMPFSLHSSYPYDLSKYSRYCTDKNSYSLRQNTNTKSSNTTDNFQSTLSVSIHSSHKSRTLMHIITTYETQNEETDVHHIHSSMQMQKNAFPKYNAAPLASSFTLNCILTLNR